ncbi:MAG: T9SS C-terminal target domain-containing protein [Calditrichaeota bacterium]|nr:MAG: T9SS C-terminal target domain-containing protein [Calditrichota bacterium]
MQQLATLKTGIFSLLVFTFFATTATSHASDLKFGPRRVDAFVEIGTSLPIEVEVVNDSNFTADSYKVFVDVKNSDEQTVFSSTIFGSNLVPYTSAILQSSENWTPGLRGKYTVNLEIDFQWEVLPDDNKTQQEITVGMGRDAAISLFDSKFKPTLGYDLSDAWAFMPQEPLNPGDTLASEDSSEYYAEIDSYQWYVWLDLKRDFRFAHPGAYITIDAVTDSCEITDTAWPPSINGETYLGDFDLRLSTSDKILGEAPAVGNIPNVDIFSDTSATSVPADSTCALIFTGRIGSDYERAAFGNDADFFAQNIRKEQLGPRLPESQVKITKNATAQEICSELDALKDRYSKIYFYYTGHGAKFWLGTNDVLDHKLRYQDLADKLYATNAQDICVVIDACHAGGLEFWMKFHDDYHKRNVTLLMSSHEDSSSYSRTIHVDGNGEEIDTGAFTWDLVKCWGDPAAEQDGEAGISLKEAFDWVRQNNPELRAGRMNDVMDPQMLIHRIEPSPVETVVRIPDADVQITQNEPQLEDDAFIHVELENVDEFEYVDENILKIYPEKKWRIGLENQFLDYNLNLQLDYRYEIPAEDTSSGEIGAVYRAEGQTWHSIPAQWDLNSKYITAGGIKSPGEWAIALVINDSITAVKDDLAGIATGFALHQNYPNPFNPQTTIAFETPEAGPVRLTLFDVNGRHVQSLLNRRLSAGRHKIVLDASKLSSGVYFYKIMAGDFRETRKMLLVW